MELFREYENKGDTIMQNNESKRFMPYMLCITLIMVMAFMTAGCTSSTKDASSDAQTNQTSNTWPDGSVIGEGNTEFTVTVVDQDGSETKLEIHTDQETVGAALSESGLIDGDEGEYGLYVKTVNGITADYEKDGMYWAFYINDEYAQTGVDATTITEGDSYSLKIEKG